MTELSSENSVADVPIFVESKKNRREKTMLIFSGVLGSKCVNLAISGNLREKGQSQLYFNLKSPSLQFSSVVGVGQVRDSTEHLMKPSNTSVETTTAVVRNRYNSSCG